MFEPKVNKTTLVLDIAGVIQDKTARVRLMVLLFSIIPSASTIVNNKLKIALEIGRYCVAQRLKLLTGSMVYICCKMCVSYDGWEQWV